MLLSFFVAFVVATIFTAWLASPQSPLIILDSPNDRSLHARPTPRTGGLAILAGIAAGWGGVAIVQPWPAYLIQLATAGALVACISFMDDLKPLSPLLRLGVHVLAAGLIVIAGPGHGWPVGLLLLLAVVRMINLYNFMDGMDGFAAGMTSSGFGFLGLAGWLAGDMAYAWQCWVIAAASAGFLLFNFPPARIFMGDVGSATLGLLAAGLSLWGVQGGLFPWWFPVLVFAPFIVDATVTLMRRACRRERVWEAHRTHYYQRLVRAGWGHRRTVLAEYALMLFTGGMALALNVHKDLALFGIAAVLALCVVLMLLVAAHERRMKAVAR